MDMFEKRSLIVISLLTLWLSGCSLETNRWKIDAASAVCEKRGGIDHLINFLGTGVVCQDGFYTIVKGKS